MDFSSRFVVGAAVAIVGVVGYVIWGPNVTTRCRGNRKEITGLVNFGNSCFLNAVLQALASCSAFVTWVCDLNSDCTANVEDKTPLLNSLSNIMNVLCGQCKPGDYTRLSDPMQILKSLRMHRWLVSRDEQDAHEMFQVIMQSLQEEVEHISYVQPLVGLSENQTELENNQGCISRFYTKLPSLQIRSHSSVAPFDCCLANQLICRVCGHKSPVSFSSCHSLSLSIPECVGITKSVRLEDCLRSFMEPEIVPNVDCDKCNSSAGGSSTSTRSSSFLKQVSIGRLPPVLCFHVQRMVWTEHGIPLKRRDFVSFPEFLEMQNYIYNPRKTSMLFGLSVAKRSLCGGGNIESNRLTNVSFKSPSAVYSSKAENSVFRQRFLPPVSHERQKIVYQLQSVIVHIGDVYSGHFVTYRRSGFSGKVASSNKWYYCSDTMVYQVSLDEVLECNAYMLFYERFACQDQSTKRIPRIPFRIIRQHFVQKSLSWPAGFDFSQHHTRI